MVPAHGYAAQRPHRRSLRRGGLPRAGAARAQCGAVGGHLRSALGPGAGARRLGPQPRAQGRPRRHGTAAAGGGAGARHAENAADGALHPALARRAEPSRADLVPRRQDRARRRRRPGLRAARGQGGDWPHRRPRRAARLPRQLPHRHRVPDHAGGGAGAAGLYHDAGCPRGGGGVRGAAGLPDGRGQPSEGLARVARPATLLLCDALPGALYLGRHRRHAEEHAPEAVSAMIRIAGAIVLLFLLPIAAYLVYAMLARPNASFAAVLNEAPFVWLSLAGMALVAAMLVYWGITSTGGGEGADAPAGIMVGIVGPAVPGGPG